MYSVNDSDSKSIIPYATRNNWHFQLPASAKLYARTQKIVENTFKGQKGNKPPNSEMGEFVLLVGGSTSGKSSILHALKKLDEEWIVCEGDPLFFKTYMANLKNYHPAELKLLQAVMEEDDIPKALMGAPIKWKPEVTEEQKNAAMEAIKSIAFIPLSDSEVEDMEFKIFNEALKHCEQGHKVIFDVLTVDSIAKYALLKNIKEPLPLKIVLVHCAFQELSDRIEKRNAKADEENDPTNKRGIRPLIHFSKLYTKKEKDKTETLETLTREQVVRIFDENYDKLLLSSPDDISLIEKKEELKSEILSNLGFTEGIKSVEISPKHHDFFDLVMGNYVITKATTPEEGAKKIRIKGGTLEKEINTYHRSTTKAEGEQKGHI